MAKAKRIENLDCEQSVTVGARLILRVRCAEMLELRDAALDWSDIEGVHNMRVASRRLRGALQDFLPYLPRAGELKRSRRELRVLAGALGAVRDEDVAIEALRSLQKERAKDGATDTAFGIELFVQSREAAREESRRALAEMIEPPRLTALQDDFNERLERATETRGAQADAMSLAATGAEIVLGRYDELRRLSRSLYRPFAVEPLHELRIAAKRLRYAIELFAGCVDGQAVDGFADRVGELQSALGGVHDCDVWIEEFGELLFAQSKRETKRAGTKSTGGDIKSAVELATDERETGSGFDTGSARETRRRAAVWLLGHFTKERTRQYRRALELWQAWRDEDFAVNLAAQFDRTKSAV